MKKCLLLFAVFVHQLISPTQLLYATHGKLKISSLIPPCDINNPTLDCDADGLTNNQEQQLGTNPNLPDTDGDGVIDATEVSDGTSPLDDCSYLSTSITLSPSLNWLQKDCDGDGVTNNKEQMDGTNTLNPCSFDSAHAYYPKLSGWLNADCDSDGLSNGDELIKGTIVLDADTDGDGVKDGTEVTDQTNPLDNCDYLSAHITLAGSNEWGMLDCDGDGVINKTEVADNTDTKSKCSYDESHITLEIINYCKPKVPEGFSPNGDGINDLLVVKAIADYPNNTLTVYNRWGNIVYKMQPYTDNWAGESNQGSGKIGTELPAGLYYYILDTGDGTPATKGTVYINR